MLKFLLIFFIVIYLLGYLGKWFFVRWVKKMSNQQYSQASDMRQEGEVTIDIDKTQSNKRFNTEGEYVDYEEVE
jgi:hypothetical protein